MWCRFLHGIEKKRKNYIVLSFLPVCSHCLLKKKKEHVISSFVFVVFNIALLVLT